MEGVGPGNREFRALKRLRAKRGPGLKKDEISRAQFFQSNAPSNGFARLKTIMYKLHIKNRYIGNFMYELACIIYASSTGT